MMEKILFVVSILFSLSKCVTGIREHTLNPLEWLGANSPWFPGPNVFDIPDETPQGCEIDQAVYIIRHGSRYPDSGAYKEWKALYNKTQSADFTAKGDLSFLPDWEPVLRWPEDQIAQLSITGYKELYNMGANLRFRYPSFYKDNTPFTVWANNFQRTIDSARLFSRGFVGPNTTFADVIIVNASNPDAIANSLAPSDLCPAYNDDSSAATTTWDATYLPKITERLQELIKGDLILKDSDVSIFPYLCGFETQITGAKSPFCNVFSEEETMKYEYRQDLRYWYGTGPGSGLESTMMLPLLKSVTGILTQGPNKTYITNSRSFKPPPLIVAFTHDNQINQLASATGVFDNQKNLTTEKIDSSRIFISSRINPMRGTVAFERMTCSSGRLGSSGRKLYIRIRLNDAIYPVANCQSGPGRSCLLEKYIQLIDDKNLKAGDFVKNCGIQSSTVENPETTFFTNPNLPWLRVIKP